MAEGVLFEMANDLLDSIGKSAFQEVSMWCSARTDLKKLEKTLRMIKARVIDAEKRSKKENNELIKEWLRRLRVVLYKADDLFDDVFIAKQRKRHMQGNMAKKEEELSGMRMGRGFSAKYEYCDSPLASELYAFRDGLDIAKAHSFKKVEIDH